MADALPSGLVPVGSLPAQGRRVVAAQRILQAQSDPFLGWTTVEAPERTGRPRVDFYWRQFRDMKGSVELDRLAASQFVRYGSCAGACSPARTASPRARAWRTATSAAPTRSTIPSRGGRALTRTSSRATTPRFEAAVTSGRLPAERGV